MWAGSGLTKVLEFFSLIRKLWSVWFLWSGLEQHVIHYALECLNYKLGLWSHGACGRARGNTSF